MFIYICCSRLNGLASSVGLGLFLFFLLLSSIISCFRKEIVPRGFEILLKRNREKKWNKTARGKKKHGKILQ